MLKTMGFSLVELLIGTAIGVSTIAVASQFIATFVASQSQTAHSIRLHEETQTLLNLIEQQTQRADFIHPSYSDAFHKPISTSLTLDTSVSKYPRGCLMFSYDKNRNGVIDTDPYDERFGFRLNNNAVEMRQDGRRCEDKGWQDLSDSHYIKIKALSFTGSIQHQSQLLTIKLDAALTHFPHINTQVQRTLLLNNYIPDDE